MNFTKRLFDDLRISFPKSNFAPLLEKIAMAKQQVLDTVKNLPDKFSIDELMERLLVLDAIEKGMQQVEEGKVVRPRSDF